MPDGGVSNKQSDWIVEYKQSVLELLSSSSKGNAVRSVEACFWPSFHGESRIFVEELDGQTSVELILMSSSFWYYNCFLREKERLQNNRPEPKRPQVLREFAKPKEIDAERFWQAIDSINALAIGDGSSMGLDGMSIDISCALQGRVNSFSAWCPPLSSNQGKCVDAIYQVAWSCVSDESMIRGLEDLHGYIYD